MPGPKAAQPLPSVSSSSVFVLEGTAGGTVAANGAAEGTPPQSLLSRWTSRAGAPTEPLEEEKFRMLEQLKKELGPSMDEVLRKAGEEGLTEQVGM